MNHPNDLHIITQYKNHTLLYPIYTSPSTQQIYNSSKLIKSCDSKGYISVAVKDEKNTYSGFKYAKFRRCALLKYNNDYNKELEQEAPYYRYFDENHQPFPKEE